jgi:serine/threonine protein kinase
MAKSIPDKLGKYEVKQEIARGSMGIVYLGHDPYIDRPVALKVALADSLKDKDSGERYRKMFFNEAHTAGMLRHPNILDIFDAGVEGDTCYIVMELVPGGRTLKEYTKTENLLPIAKVVEIIFKCAKALDYAHRQGVIHRDIKPSNILLHDDLDVKIADFSIAHITRTDTTQTMPMGFVGSPRYMSPEQVQEEYITSQTDLFSLGIVMYELLTGKHPFGGESFSSLVHRVVNEDPVPLRDYRSGLPETLEKIVMHALQKDPARRYKMGLDLASDLSTAFGYLGRPQEDISIKEKFNNVKQLGFFQGFPDSEIWEIIRASVWQEYAAGEEIIIEGDIEDSFYIITDGKVSVSKAGIGLGQLGRGDCFGEMGYLNKIKRTATITAQSRVSLMKVNSTLIEQVSKDCQLRFCKVFLRVLIERLSLTTEKVARAG